MEPYKLLKFHQRIDRPMELSEIAAEKAAVELAVNWASALEGGALIADLVEDVDRVTRYLTEWAQATRVFVQSGLDYENIVWANRKIEELLERGATGHIEYVDGVYEVQIAVKKNRSIDISLLNIETGKYEWLIGETIKSIIFAQ